MKYQNDLRGAKLAVTSYVIERPPLKTDQEAKAFSNFLSRQIRGPYWTVRSDLRIILITKSAFPEAIRLRTKYIIEDLMPDVLNEPWSQSFAKRITRPHGQKEQKVKNTDSAYAQWISHEGGESLLRLKAILSGLNGYCITWMMLCSIIRGKK